MNNRISQDVLSSLCEQVKKNNRIDPTFNEKYHVKTGLRNPDGSGVMAGLTKICNVHGYVISEGEKEPIDGRLIYRGIDVNDIVKGAAADGRFGFEETVWLFLFGELPNEQQLKDFREALAMCRELPEYFAEDIIMKTPSKDIMNKLQRCVLGLYAYDDNPDDTSLMNVLEQSINLIALMPSMMVHAYQVKRRHFDHESMFIHPNNIEHHTAEFILSSLRPDREFTDEEAKLLDLCLVLHAEHGGGNNSTFTTRVVTSSGTDTYSAIGAAIGSLKGPRHGGANIKVMSMLDNIKSGVKNHRDMGEIKDYLVRIMKKEAGDGSGLIYGMGHAVYTLSDPRAIILKDNARNLAEAKGFGDDFALLEAVETLTPEIFAEFKGDSKNICANVDLYSGLVYKALGIPPELYTPIFAVARTAGWCAHRIEEIATCGRIIRPAYKAIMKSREYTSMTER